MWNKNRLSLAVSAALASTVPGFAQGAGIEEIIVTATKREESTQDIPIAVQAMTSNDLEEMRVETFDKYLDYLPNVVSAGNGPGKKEVYIRGSATEQSGVTVSAAQGSAPGVALYVDEQPVSFGGRNLDVYAADIERIEVLSGPQGTLFGASSQSGNLRLITNKPVYGEYAGGFDAKYAATRSGADSGSVNAYANIPFGDYAAARIAVYSDTQGGWIDNVPAGFTPSGEVVDRNNAAGYGPVLTRDNQDTVATASNDILVQSDWNEASYRGLRLGLAFDINENWDVLLQHTAQTLEVEGSFLVDPTLGDGNDSAFDRSANFAPEYNRDEFGLTHWTLTGRIANLDAIYTGGILTRDVDSVIDYTHYNNGGGYITYYLCGPQTCFDPTKQYLEDTSNQRITHEFRLQTDAVNRLRLLGGFYYNDMETNHVGEFQYLSANQAFGEQNGISNFRLGNTTINTPGVNTSGPRGPLTTFFNDFTRQEEEWALFGEIAFDLTDSLTAAFSARYYELTSGLEGAANFSFGCRYGFGADGVMTADGRCNGVGYSNDVTARLLALGQYRESGDESFILNAASPNGARDLFRGGGSNQATLDAIRNGHLDLSGLNADGAIEESDTIMRVSLDWQAADQTLVFFNFAQGYRPATQNRNAGQLAVNQAGIYQNYVVPAVARTDTLTSYEAGVKADLFDRSVRLNATLYFTEIEDLQVSRFDPSNVAFLVFMENVGDAETSGLDVDFQWAASDALTFIGAFSLLDTEITRLNSQLQGIAVPVGSELPLASAFSGNLRARYDFYLDNLDLDGYVNASVNYRGEHKSGLAGSAEFMDDSQFRYSGEYSGLKIHREGGTFGSVEIPDGQGGMRLPYNSRFVNPASTTFNMAFGLQRDTWVAELFIDNLTNEEAPVMQIAGHYTPLISVQRPRTLGLRLSYDLE